MGESPGIPTAAAAAKRGAGQIDEQLYLHEHSSWSAEQATDAHPSVFFFFSTASGASSFSFGKTKKKKMGG